MHKSCLSKKKEKLCWLLRLNDIKILWKFQIFPCSFYGDIRKKQTSEIYVKRRVVYLRRIIIFTNQIYTNNIYDYMYNKLYSSTFTSLNSSDTVLVLQRNLQ